MLKTHSSCWVCFGNIMFSFEYTPSASPLIETIWCSQSPRAGSFTSLATTQSEIVIAKHAGRTSLTVRGPETRATLAAAPADAEFFGITLRLGAFIPSLPATALVDRHATLPEATSQSFWLDDTALALPNFEDAEDFVERLVRRGLLQFDLSVEAMLRDQPLESDQSLRSFQRRFLNVIGITQRTVRQIERARAALALLQSGRSIADVVFQAGYSDQPHMTKALRQLVGRTPARVVSEVWTHSGLTLTLPLLARG